MIYLLLFSAFFQSALSDTTAKRPVRPDTTRANFAISDSVLTDSLQIIYQPQKIESQSFFLSDSLTRWTTNMDLYEWMERTPGFLTFRPGSYGRFSGFSSVYSEFETISWEGIPLKNPIAGNQRLELLPMFEFSSLNSPNNSFSRLDFSEQEMGLLKPRTEFNYQHSKYSMRSLQARFSRNVTRRLGFDMAITGEDETGQYPRQQLRAFTARNKVWYKFESVEVGARMLYAVDRNNESDGYQIPDMAFFGFQRFFTAPNSAAHLRTKDAYYSAYLKGKSPWKSIPTFTLNTWLRNNEHRFRNATDTLGIFSRTLGINATTQLKTRFLDIQPRIESQTTQFADRSQFTRNGVSSLILASTMRLGIDGIELSGDFSTETRSDSRAGYQTLVAASANYKWLALDAGVARVQQLPSLMAMYAESPNFISNPNLRSQKENRVFARGKVEMGISEISFGTRLSQFNDRVMLRADSNFSNVAAHVEFHSFLAYKLNAKHWEILISADGQQISSSNSSEILFDNRFRLWNRSGLWYKGYAFNKAAYIKGGVVMIWAPLSYATMSYVPEMSVWNLPMESVFIPGWARVDIDFSARIRSVFLVARMENAFDGVGQLGYFQTSHYPMPSRRFRLGIRWVLRN